MKQHLEGCVPTVTHIDRRDDYVRHRASLIGTIRVCAHGNVDPVRSKYPNVLKPWVMALPAPNGLGKTLRTNSGPCNVVLRPFRMFSLGQRVQPATMIGFKQIEFFDHTGLPMASCPRHWRSGPSWQ